MFSRDGGSRNDGCATFPGSRPKTSTCIPVWLRFQDSRGLNSVGHLVRLDHIFLTQECMGFLVRRVGVQDLSCKGLAAVLGKGGTDDSKSDQPGLNRISKFPASVPTPKGLSLGIGVRGMGRASPGFK